MRSRLGALGGFAAVIVVGVAAFALVLTLKETPEAFTVGVQSSGPVVTVRGGQTACQQPLDVPRGGAFDRVRLKIGTFRAAGPPLTVAVRGAGGAVLARGGLPAGYPDITVHNTYVVALSKEIGAGAHGLSVCVSNAGPNRIALYGNGDAAAPGSTATLDGKGVGVDIDMIFERKPRSYASELGTILSRAVLFRSPRLSDTVYFIVLVLLVAAAIAGVAAAVRSAAEPPSGPPNPNA